MTMKRLLSGIAVLVIFFAAAASQAAGGCPASADNLAGYAGCLAPVRGGAVYRGTMADLDEDHQRVMAAMSRTTMTPPQVIPSYNPIPYGYGMYGGMFPFYPAVSNAYGVAAWGVIGAVSAARGGNPYVWVSAGYPIY